MLQVILLPNLNLKKRGDLILNFFQRESWEKRKNYSKSRKI